MAAPFDNRSSLLRRRKRRPWWPLLLSLGLHVLLGFLVVEGIAPLFERSSEPVPQEIEWVNLDPPAESRTRRQVVSAPYANDLEPEEEAYLAERSSRVEKEIVGPQGTPAPGPQAALNTPGESGKQGEETGPRKQDAAERPKTLEELLPSGTEIARLVQGPPPGQERPASGTETPNDNPTAQAGETLDKLDPSIERGALTLLNKKAFRYASFINRMIYRVFSYYERRLRSSNTLLFLREREESVAIVEAILNKQGEQLATRLIGYEGNPAIADAARYAMEQGAWDLNPPSGAEATDGLIHFRGVFKFRGNPHNGYYYYELGVGLD